MSITGIFLSRKLPVAKVVARDSYNANLVAALYHCSKSYSFYQVWWWHGDTDFKAKYYTILLNTIPGHRTSILPDSRIVEWDGPDLNSPKNFSNNASKDDSL